MYQFSGVNTITFYAVEIFQDTGTTMNKTTCTIMLGVVRLLFTIIACIAMRRFGRRTLTFVSGNNKKDYQSIADANILYVFFKVLDAV